MDIAQITKLRSFVAKVVSYIIIDYGSFLSEEKRKLLDEKRLVPDDFNMKFTSPQNLQGELIRLVFRKVFEHIECTKNFEFSNSENKSIPYGEFLKEGLVVYFTNELSTKYGIKVDEVPELKGNLELIIKLKEKLDQNFAPLIFNCDANVILSACNLPELTKICDGDAVKKYIQSQKKSTEQNDKELVESVSNNGKIFPPIYANGIQYIKYLDASNEVHMIRSTNPQIVTNAYKEMVEALKPGEELDSEKFFQVLRQHGENIPLMKESDVNRSRLSSEESHMLSAIYTDKEVKEATKDNAQVHSADMTVHIVNNDVRITNQSDTGKVTQLDFDHKEGSTEPQIQPDEQNAPRLITEEEYSQLCMKSVNNKQLTEEELRELEYFDLYYYGESTIKSNLSEEYKPKGQTLKMENQTQAKPQGFAQKFFPVIAIVITIMMGMIIGIVIFKVKSMF